MHFDGKLILTAKLRTHELYPKRGSVTFNSACPLRLRFIPARAGDRLQIGRTNIEHGFMATIRAIAQPQPLEAK